MRQRGFYLEIRKVSDSTIRSVNDFIRKDNIGGTSIQNKTYGILSGFQYQLNNDYKFVFEKNSTIYTIRWPNEKIYNNTDRVNLELVIQTIQF